MIYSADVYYLTCPSAKTRVYCHLLNKCWILKFKCKILNNDIHNERKQLYQKNWPWLRFKEQIVSMDYVKNVLYSDDSNLTV